MDRDPLRLLLAEDDALLRRMLADQFAPPGWNTVAVHDGAQAIFAVVDHDPHLLLTDLHMPVIDGFELILAIRTHAAYADLPVIVLTGAYRRGNPLLRELPRCVIFEKGGISMADLVETARVLAEVRREQAKGRPAVFTRP